MRTILGTTAVAMASTNRAPARMMPDCSASGPDHEAAHVLDEEDRQPLAVGRLDEVGHLLGAAGVDDAAEARALARLALDHAALVGDHRDRPSLDMRVAA